MHICSQEEIDEKFDTIKESITLRVIEHETVIFCFDEYDDVFLQGAGREKYSHKFQTAQFYDIELHLNEELLRNLTVEEYNTYILEMEGLVQVMTISRNFFYDPNEYEDSFIKTTDSMEIEGFIRMGLIRDKEANLVEEVVHQIHGLKIFYEYNYEEVESHQNFINPITAEEASFYSLNKANKFEWQPRSLTSPVSVVEVSLNKNIIMHERDIYNALDFIGDIGGLKEGLMQISAVIMFISGFIVNNPMTRYLVNSVYLSSPTDTPQLKIPIFSLLQPKSTKSLYDRGESKIEKALDIEDFLAKQYLMWKYVKSKIPKADFKADQKGKDLKIKVDRLD